MIAGSKVTPSRAAEIACWEIPCAAASRLKPASQASKLPVLRQRGAAPAGSDRTATARAAAPAIPKIRCHICRRPQPERNANCAIRLVIVKFTDQEVAERPIEAPARSLT